MSGLSWENTKELNISQNVICSENSLGCHRLQFAMGSKNRSGRHRLQFAARSDEYEYSNLSQYVIGSENRLDRGPALIYERPPKIPRGMKDQGKK